MKKVIEIITEQQKGHENDPVFMVGEQLKEIAEKEPISAELLEKDLLIEGMGIKDAEAKLKDYADKHHKSARSFCIGPQLAEKILREFYGLPSPEQETKATDEPVSTYIDLSSFL